MLLINIYMVFHIFVLLNNIVMVFYKFILNFLYTSTGRQVCIDVELALKKRITHKWTILKTLKDKQQLEKLLNEITVSFIFKYS